MDDQLLQRDRDDLQAERLRLPTVARIPCIPGAYDSGREQVAKWLARDYVPARRKGIDRHHGADDRKRPPAQRIGIRVENQPALVDDEDMFEQPTDLVDQVRRQDDRARML